jgi:hypothetical protein
MEYFPQLPAIAADLSCGVCDHELVITEPAMVDMESSSDLGDRVAAQHVHCFRAVQMARADAFAEAASVAQSYMCDTARALLNLRARQCAAALDVTVPR